MGARCRSLDTRRLSRCRASIGVAAEYADALPDDCTSALEGAGNEEVAERADVVVATVPARHLRDAVESVARVLDGESILLSPAVCMNRDEAGVHYAPPAAGSATELAAEGAPEEVPVVGAFHSLPAGRLAAIDEATGWDTIVVGDDGDAKAIVSKLVEDIDGVRALDGGPLANAADVESVTPLLVTLSMHNEGMHDIGIRVR